MLVPPSPPRSGLEGGRPEPPRPRRGFGAWAARPVGADAARCARLAVVVCAALVGGCTRDAARPPQGTGKPSVPTEREATTGPASFLDRAAALGIAATYRNGQEAGHCSILESLGGGVGWIDYDRDGWLDLVATGGGGFGDGPSVTGQPTSLWRSGPVAGAPGRHFTAVAAAAGLDTLPLYTHGVACGDIDDDGFADLVVTGFGPPQLWHNLGDGRFRRIADWVAAADPRWSSSAGWADLDGDGDLDLYLARYVDWSFARDPVCGRPTERDICPPREFNGLADSIYRNDGDGTFTEVSRAAGLRTDGKGLGVLLADVDLDGHIDIYVGNDTVDNFLYMNRGEGTFAEQGLVAGVALDDQGVPNGSMGVELCDFNRDGRPDLWVANYEREAFALYRNEGRGQFLHVSRRHGITALGGLFVGFGTVCADLDLDGLLDIVVANGHVIKFPDASPRRQVPLLLSFDGDRFRRAGAPAGTYFAEPHEGRGLAAGDYDGDGDFDLAISQLEEPVAVLENMMPRSARPLVVHLTGTRSNRDAIGARVTLVVAGEPPLEMQLTGGGSYLSHGERALVFPLPRSVTATPSPRLVVRWPSGSVSEVDVPSAAAEGDGPTVLRLVEPAAPARGT
jgi:hypothetical protein